MVLLTSYSGDDIRSTPNKWAQNRCHGITGFLETGPRNLHFMIEYIKNPKAYKLQNRHISSGQGPGNITQFASKWSKTRSHTHIKYLNKIMP